MSDKNQAIIDFLIRCPIIRNNPLYFNFINAKENNKQIIALANDIAVNKAYIDGSVDKRYSATIVDFKSVAYNQIVKEEGLSDENVTDMSEVQEIIDWVNAQVELASQDYEHRLDYLPDFGGSCVIDTMRVTTENPRLNSIDTQTTPVLAKYSFTIQVDYLDISKKLWHNNN